MPPQGEEARPQRDRVDAEAPGRRGGHPPDGSFPPPVHPGGAISPQAVQRDRISGTKEGFGDPDPRAERRARRRIRRHDDLSPLPEGVDERKGARGDHPVPRHPVLSRTGGCLRPDGAEYAPDGSGGHRHRQREGNGPLMAPIRSVIAVLGILLVGGCGAGTVPPPREAPPPAVPPPGETPPPAGEAPRAAPR